MEINSQRPHDNELPVLPEVTLEAFKTRALYEGMPLSMAGTLALVIILSTSHWNIIGHGALIFWNLLICCAVFIRVVSWYFWRQNAQILSTTAWLTIFRAGAWLAGIAWGSSAFLMFANYNPSYQALLAYTIAGVSSGSFTTLAYDKHAAIGFVGLAIFPLTIRLFLEHGPIAVPMGIMSVIYLVFVVSAAGRARRNLEDQHEKNMRLLTWSKERIQQQQINKSISQAKSLFIKDANINNVFMSLLQDTLELTNSKFGFIGEVIHSEHETELQLHAVSNISIDNHLTAFYQIQTDTNSDETASKMLAKNIPFATTIMHGKPIISNDPSKDIRGGGLPGNHPPLSSFLGVPIFIGTTQVALLGIANKPNGYDEHLMEFIKPVTESLAQFFEAILHNRQQKLYEIQLQNNAKHTQAILDEVFDAIITIDQYGIIKSFNHAAEMIFGYRAEEVINISINHLILSSKPEDNKDSNHTNSQSHHLHFAIADGQEHTGVRRNGKEFPIHLATSKILIEGAPLIISVVRDMSESKRNEELKNQFISTLSHELRTPLTSISGALSILKNNIGDANNTNPEQQQKLINIALHNSTRLQTLINDLLDIDKLIANKMEMNIAPYCIVEIVNKSIESNQIYAEKNNVKLQLLNTPPKTLIYGDARRIHQVLSNLLSNAAKFSFADSTVDITINTAGKFARVTITDHGEGIPETFKHKIFQRFTQADSSDTRQKGGSGLGLAISKELIQKMGGNIGFTSKEGKGSSFYFELPLFDITVKH